MALYLNNSLSAFWKLFFHRSVVFRTSDAEGSEYFSEDSKKLMLIYSKRMRVLKKYQNWAAYEYNLGSWAKLFLSNSEFGLLELHFKVSWLNPVKFCSSI